jgi:hypothetical protein
MRILRKNLVTIDNWIYSPKLKKLCETNLLDFKEEEIFEEKKAEDSKSSAKEQQQKIKDFKEIEQ